VSIVAQVLPMPVAAKITFRPCNRPDTSFRAFVVFRGDLPRLKLSSSKTPPSSSPWTIRVANSATPDSSSRDNRIVAVGPSVEPPATADEIPDLRGHIVLPGLINTHHHIYQSLTRAVPAAQDAELFGWLETL